VGVKRVHNGRWGKDPTRYNKSNEAEGNSHVAYGKFEACITTDYADPDGLETVADWLCEPGCPVAELSAQSGESKSTGGITNRSKPNTLSWANDDLRMTGHRGGLGDTGTAARFYPNHDWSYEIAERLAGVTPFRYQAKAARKERDAGLDEFELQDWELPGRSGLTGRKRLDNSKAPLKGGGQSRNPHPTVKPIALTRWLATLLLPPPEYAPRRILVPFSGSGSEMIGAGLAGWDEIIGVEMEPEYVAIAEARLAHWLENVQMEMSL
jgi:hypothetical protein